MDQCGHLLHVVVAYILSRYLCSFASCFCLRPSKILTRQAKFIRYFSELFDDDAHSEIDVRKSTLRSMSYILSALQTQNNTPPSVIVHAPRLQSSLSQPFTDALSPKAGASFADLS